MQIAQLHGHGHIVHHAAARNGHLAAAFHRQINDLLHTVQVAGKGGNDNTALAGLDKQLAHALGHLLLGGGKAGALGVSGIAQQRQHAFFAVARKGIQIGHAACQRGVVHLKVAGLNHHARRAVDGKGHGIGNGVVYMNGLNGKAAQAEFFVAANFDQLGRGQQAMLIQLVFDQADGQACGVHRHGALAQKIRQAADMVFVAVGDDHALDLFTVLLDKSEIGDHQINAVHILVGEDRAAVHQQHIALALVQGDVFAHFAQTAQRINVQLGALFVRCRAAGALRARGALGRQLFLGRRLGLGSRRCALGANGRLTGSPGSHFRLLGGASGLFALLGLCLGLGCGLCRLGALGLTGLAAIVAAGGLFIGAAGLCSRGLFFHIAHSSSKRAAAKNALRPHHAGGHSTPFCKKAHLAPAEKNR